MSEPEAPKIEFPCENYPIKVVGETMADYEQVIVEIVRVHAEDCDFERIRIQESSNGRFRSVTLYITATGKEQLVSIHKDLMAHPNVRMVI
ncbi:MAG: hypothetical protein CSH37_04965 [Thalassolituus sp.]|uniref:UPF0250 protein NBRC116585_04890 n=1 Tax=Thalassolituus maritimus TaxID=484498 RepID=A0ABP9ZW58_9GAMM|nr:DUF493 family protein [Pseudomonadota bacterium]MEC8104663.1 DUF493 family protein [Pseudomonadota bacterium]MEC8523053.1 DUF493 family protein [Pseudomonadota bacterium]MEE2748523.1 DUF493 family protein [Pseudomonadota bacterium]TNC86182.1 MAG: hypothetical protein CSH37_04965 [Thalassolituus sp.]